MTTSAFLTLLKKKRGLSHSAVRPFGSSGLAVRSGFTFTELVIVITIIAALAGMGFPIYSSVRKANDENATRSMIQAVATAMSTYQLKTWTWETAAAIGTTPARMRTYRMWDLNHFDSTGGENPDIKVANGDSIPPGPDKFFSIDGYTPGSKSYHAAALRTDAETSIVGPTNIEVKNGHDGNFPTAIIKSGYTGFLNMVAPIIHKSFIDNRGIIVDSWKNPLRIKFQAQTFGPEGVGIWSPGYNKKDDTFRSDSLTGPQDIPEDTDDLRSWK
jgi:prepilin-type N-terminal cleavage/methylation domain-containing protein